MATISYFDIFDFPLTVMEIWRWLYVADTLPGTDIVTVQRELEGSEYLRQRLAAQSGFYFLRGRADIVQTRHERYSLAEQKYHTAKRMIRILRWVPWVKMIGVCNTLSYSNSRADGDIDLFIVARRHRIWQTRWWVTGFLKIFGLRPTPDRTRNKICSSFFVGEDNLDLQSVALPHDTHFAYWAMQIVPVYDEGVYDAFFAANTWARAQLPHVAPIVPTSRRIVPVAGVFKLMLRACSSIFPERLFRWLQMRIMPDRLKSAANHDTRVVVNDGMLKFHNNDRRQLFFDRWQQRLQEVL